MAVTICVIVILAVILYHNRELFTQLKGEEKLGLWSPPILITGVIIIFNLISWAMIPWWWNVMSHTWYSWLFFNIGFWSVLYLRTIKVKDATGKDTKEDNPTTSKMATIIGVLLIAGLLTTAGLQVHKWWENKQKSAGGARSITAGFYPTLGSAVSPDKPPTQIADCESGLRNPDGTAVPGSATHMRDGKVVRNPPDAGPGKGATGYWQIKQDDPWVKALLEKHDLDPEKEEDNHEAARLLWKERKTAPWTASAPCWAGKITMPGGIIVPLEAPIDRLAPYPIPLDFNFNISSGGKKCRIELSGTVEENGVRKPFVVTRDIGTGKPKEKIPGKTALIRVQSLESEPVIVKVTLTPKT